MSFRRSLVALLTTTALAVVGCSSGEPPALTETVAQSALPLSLPASFTDQVIASGLSNPTSMSFAPDGRLFVTQQGGQLRVIKDGALLSMPFMTLTVNSTGERGLLGVAFDPAFSSNQRLYVYYTATTPTIHNRVSRFTANGDVVSSGSEVVLLDLPTLSATNHNGGAMHFGKDGKLYVATGENAQPSNAQSLSNPLGKLLRINSDGSIPSDNPFLSRTSGTSRSIWALGLRNPFTFDVQPGTGRIFINDVGQEAVEEINDGIAGSNYGWPTTEGSTSDPNFRSPIHTYSHSSGCAITGGAFYNPSTVRFPSSFVGKYFFADYCNNWIRAFDPSSGTSASFASGLSSPVDLDVAADGRLFYLMRGSGSSTGVVGAIGYSTAQAPAITSQPSNQTVAAGQVVTFSVAATGSQPLAYQWQRGTTNISGATGSSYTFTTTASDNGATFRVVVTNTAGSVTSTAATLTISTNAAPTATITSPASGSTYRGGDAIVYEGTGSDPETGSLPASAFTWEVVFHHDTHTHPFFGPVSGSRSGFVTIPRTGETATDVFYRFHLTVRDPAGLTRTVTRDVAPQVSRLNFATNPPGLRITLDGTPLTTPVGVDSVVGITRQLGVVSPQSLSGTNYDWTSWSDGGAATHNINTPASATTYTANYTASSSGSVNLASIGQPIALVTEPTGGGNHNIEVIRDGVKPAVGSSSSAQQYDTYSGGGSNVDWIGYSFSSTQTFSEVVFQEGKQFGNGGWFSNLTVQVRRNGTWSTVSGLQIQPAYPGANGVNFETFRMTFSAVQGDGIRIYGTPQGAARFISVAELEVYGGTQSPPEEPEEPEGNLASLGQPIALVMQPTGGGNHNIEVIRDGVKPAVGSSVSSTQYDTYSGGASRPSDWIGYSFPTSHSFTRVVFQEGRHFGDGGWFGDLTVQVRQNGSWVTVSQLVVQPAYPGNNGTSFETFVLGFAPITGDAIRIVGTPGGSARFVSVGELEVYASGS